MRKWFAAALVLGLLGVTAGTAGASTHAAATPGVTNSEIDLGVTYVDLSTLKSVVNIDFGDWQKIYQAVIDDKNAQGGVNGRKIVPSFAPVTPLGTAPAQEACLKLTEDRHVFAVTGFFLGDAPICYAGQHATPVVNGQQTADRLAQTKAPWFTLEADDQVYAQAVDAFVKDGTFKGAKLGIITDGNSQSLYDNVVGPELKKQKVSGTTAEVTAPQGDEVALEAQISPILERFKSEGVNKILVVGSTLVQIANVLAKMDYRPQLVVMNSANLRAFTQDKSSNLDVVKNAISANVATDFNEPGEQKCFKVVTKATGYQIQETAPPGQPDYRSSAEIACRSIALFSEIAKAAGKNLTVQSFGKAPAKTGSFDVPGSGKVTYDTKAKRFVQPVYIFRYDPATKLVVQDAKPSA